MILWWLVGCTSTVQFPNTVYGADTGFGRQVFVETLFWTCESGNPDWDFELSTDGFADRVVLDIHRPTTGQAERHEMVLFASSPAYETDLFRLSLSVVGGSYISGRSTVFPCTSEDGLAFVARVHNRFGRMTDCVVAGPAAGQMSSLLAQDSEIASLGGCTAF